MDSTLVVIATIVALIAFTILCFVAVSVLLHARRQLDRMVMTAERSSNDLHELRTRLTPVLVRSEELLQQLHSTVQRADQQIDKISRGADAFASIAQDVKEFEVGIMNRIRPSVEDVVSLIAGATKGATTFIKTLMNR